MHAVGRTTTHYCIYRMLLDPFGKEAHRWPNPKTPGIRYEYVTTQPYRQPLSQARSLFLRQKSRVDFFTFFGTNENLVQLIWLPNGLFDHCHAFGHISLQRVINYRHLTVGRRINNRIPSKLRKVLNKLQPTLNASASTGWPIIGNDQNPFPSQNDGFWGIMIVIVLETHEPRYPQMPVSKAMNPPKRFSLLCNIPRARI